MKYLNLAVTLALATIVTASSAVLSLRVDSLTQFNAQEAQRRAVLKTLEAMRLHLELELTVPLMRTLGVATFLTANGGITPASFDVVAQIQLKGESNLIGMALSRGNVITNVYPMMGKTSGALGADYRKLPLQWSSVQRASKPANRAWMGQSNWSTAALA